MKVRATEMLDNASDPSHFSHGLTGQIIDDKFVTVNRDEFDDQRDRAVVLETHRCSI